MLLGEAARSSRRCAFNAWTRDGGLRAPVFKGLRADVDPRSVYREDAAAAAVVDVMATTIRHDAPAASGIERAVASVVDQLETTTKADFTLDVDGVPIKLTNLDKEFWPATEDHPARTKRELIRYYARVAPYLLPHLKDRPLTLTRYPNGDLGQVVLPEALAIGLPEGVPRRARVDLLGAQRCRRGVHPRQQSARHCIWLAQLADLETPRVDGARQSGAGRPRHARRRSPGREETMDASVLNYPDFMVFDLDPYIYAGTRRRAKSPRSIASAFEKTREMAFALKALLEQLRLSSFVKTTGKTGLHIYVPVLRQYTYDEIRAASAAVGQYMVQQFPDDLTMEWATVKRTGMIFFDHNQNTPRQDARRGVLAAAVAGSRRLGARDVGGAGPRLPDRLRLSTREPERLDKGRRPVVRHPGLEAGSAGVD